LAECVAALTPTSYQPRHLRGDLSLILGWASRLYAFSAYPHPTIATQRCPW